MRAASTKSPKPVDPVRAHRHMRWLHHISLVMIISGVALIILGTTTGAGPTITLIGAMLVVAGIVKVVVVRLWHGFFAEVLQPHPTSERSNHE